MPSIPGSIRISLLCNFFCGYFCYYFCNYCAANLGGENYSLQRDPSSLP